MIDPVLDFVSGIPGRVASAVNNGGAAASSAGPTEPIAPVLPPAADVAAKRVLAHPPHTTGAEGQTSNDVQKPPAASSTGSDEEAAGNGPLGWLHGLHDGGKNAGSGSSSGSAEGAGAPPAAAGNGISSIIDWALGLAGKLIDGALNDSASSTGSAQAGSGQSSTSTGNAGSAAPNTDGLAQRITQIVKSWMADNGLADSAATPEHGSGKDKTSTVKATGHASEPKDEKDFDPQLERRLAKAGLTSTPADGQSTDINSLVAKELSKASGSASSGSGSAHNSRPVTGPGVDELFTSAVDLVSG
ncbi:MAG: hypothetical protein ACRD0H_25120, partial [Actinomycetes bacterium]